MGDEDMQGLFVQGRETGVLQNAELRQSDQVSVPFTYGVLYPVALIPNACTAGTPDNLSRMRFVLAHELCHVRRHDVALKFVLAVALVLHWFNLMAWVMWVLANRDIELACDETVVCLLGCIAAGKTRASYARALIEMEETKSGLAPLTLCSAFNKTAIEERIAAIRHIKKATCASLIASSLLIVGAPAAFASTTYWILPNGAEAYSYSYGSADVAASTDGDETASTPQAIDGEGRPRGSADGAAIASGLDDGAVASAAGPGDIASAVENGLITSVAVSDDMVTTLADADAGGAVGTTEDDAVAYLNSLKPLGLAWEFETTTETMENGDAVWKPILS